VKIEIKETLKGGYQVSFSIAHQSFVLEQVETKKEAEFYLKNLKAAFSRFEPENISNAFYDEWCKSQDKIIKKNGYAIVPRFDIKKLSNRAAKKIHK
jgi:hypothetical protein